MGDKLLDVDYQKLSHQNGVSNRKVYRLDDVRDKIEKIAFDVVRFKDDDDLSKLWIVHKVDGGEVIVAAYEDDGEGLEAKSTWKAVPDKAANIHIFYKGNPVSKIALASLGIPESDAFVVCRTLTNKLGSDRSMLTALLDELPATDRQAFLEKYPELK